MKKPFYFLWRQPGGLDECPYFKRTVLGFRNWSVRVHEWYADDDTRNMHDHPHWFWTIVLRGGYTDVSANGEDRMRFGSIRFRRADYAHAVTKVIPGSITVLVTGPSTRRWGFWVNGKLIKRDKYFAVHGHHPCDSGDAPVRLKPGGARINNT